jgi:hypothetical protein
MAVFVDNAAVVGLNFANTFAATGFAGFGVAGNDGSRILDNLST